MDISELKIHKGTVSPDFKHKVILTNSPWRFVSLYLKRNKSEQALFYWKQSERFYDATKGLPPEASPLLLYYSFMNAAKSLLEFKRIQFNPYHGVTAHDTPASTRKRRLANTGVKIKSKGIAPSLSKYFQEKEISNTHNLKDIFYNLVHIHRTFTITYKSSPDLFLPLKNPNFKLDTNKRTILFLAEKSPPALSSNLYTKLPDKFEIHNGQKIEYDTAVSAMVDSLTNSELSNFSDNYIKLREHVRFISGNYSLWYLKLKGPKYIQRHDATLILIAMHRLSDLVRYSPNGIISLMSGEANWLLSEFLDMSSNQFLDIIASEITGCQFMTPNVRAPK